MLAAELAHIDDDIFVLSKNGYPVVVDRQATRRDLIDAVTAEDTAGVYSSSHGSADGQLQCCDGDLVRPDDLDPAAASPALRLVVLGTCYVGAHAAAWRTALGDRPLVTGWGRPVTLDRADPYTEGVELCGLEARVGPMSALLTPERLPAGSAASGRVALMAGDNGAAEIVTQSFTPLAGASARDLTAHCYQVARQADALEMDIFGID